MVRSIAQRVRNHFNLSVAEVGGQDTWQRAVLGLAAAGRDEIGVRRVLERAAEFIEELHLAEVRNVDIEVVDLPHEEGLWDPEDDEDPERRVTRRTERIAARAPRARSRGCCARRSSDPRIGLVTLTRVDVAPDLSHALVFWSALDGDGEAAVAACAGRARERGAVPAPARGARARAAAHAGAALPLRSVARAGPADPRSAARARGFARPAHDARRRRRGDSG